MIFEGPSEITIKRVNRPGYFGISSYPKSTTTLGAEISKTGYNTGLSEDEEAHYEKALGLKPGELSKHSKWWGEVFNTEHSLKLFNTKGTTLLLDSAVNQIKYKVLLASSKIANSELEKNNPNCEFYIVDEEAKAKKESEIFDYKYEAFELLMGLSPENKRKALRLFGKKGVDTMSETVIKAELTKELEKDPMMFVSILKDKRLNTKMFIEELLEYRLINREGNYFKHNDDTIANSTEECVEYFDNPKNQSVKLALETRLKKAKKG